MQLPFDAWPSNLYFEIHKGFKIIISASDDQQKHASPPRICKRCSPGFEISENLIQLGVLAPVKLVHLRQDFHNEAEQYALYADGTA